MNLSHGEERFLTCFIYTHLRSTGWYCSDRLTEKWSVSSFRTLPSDRDNRLVVLRLSPGILRQRWISPEDFWEPSKSNVPRQQMVSSGQTEIKDQVDCMAKHGKLCVYQQLRAKSRPACFANLQHCSLWTHQESQLMRVLWMPSVGSNVPIRSGGSAMDVGSIRRFLRTSGEWNMVVVPPSLLSITCATVSIKCLSHHNCRNQNTE